MGWNPANATSVSPTQAMAKPSNTAAAFVFEEVQPFPPIGGYRMIHQ
jgi:hypothetical protein